MIDIILNPVSGKGAGKKVLKTVETYLNSNQIPYKVHQLQKAGDGIEIAKKLCREGSEKIAVIGGDGTFHEVLNGMDFSNCRLGLIPAGRGNDFVGGTFFSSNTIKALEAIVKGEPLDVDYIQVGKRRCLNVCGTGLDIEVLKLTDRYKNFLSYSGSLVKCLLDYEPYTVSVKVNGREQVYKCVMAGLCNGTQFGGGIKLCPSAKPDDGKLNLLVVTEPRVPTIWVMPCFKRGKHIGKYWVEHIECESAKITCLDQHFIELDGEIYEDNVIDAKIVAGGFKTFRQ